MSLKRTKKYVNTYEPKIKLRKYDKQLKICYIFKLPDELLEKIVSLIPYWHFPRLRKSCRRLKIICDSVLLHKFQSSLHHFGSSDPKSFENASLTAIKEATWAYISCGFESTFCGSILPLLSLREGFKFEAMKIKSFLKHFYKLCNAKSGGSNSHTSRLLYCITLMGFLKKFKNSRLITSVLIPPNYWRFELELHGPWIGVLWTSKKASESHKRSKLLMILCEIMIADKLNEAFKKVYECDSEVFVFGNDASKNNELSEKPTAVITLEIRGPKKITLLLKSCLEDCNVQLPEHLPKGEFFVSLDISCKDAAKYGCYEYHHIELEPFSGLNFKV